VGAQHFRSGENIAAPRDGIPRDSNDAATDTIPDNAASAVPNTVETRRFGMHESYDYYQLCQRTERNKGLYTADQRVRRDDQRGTRQNPNGNRNGLECPEERDYYPWWHPSPWVDIAVLTNEAGDTPCSRPQDCTTQRCRYYLTNSFNIAKKGYCDVLHSPADNVDRKLNSQAWQSNRWHNNRGACERAGFTWYEVSLRDNLTSLTPPVCQKTQFARVNHLGNAFDSSVTFTTSGNLPGAVATNRFLWKVPNIPTPRDANAYFSRGIEAAYRSCALRIRYNITTADMPVWPPGAMEVAHPFSNKMVTAANNSRTDDDPRTPLQQNPYVYIGPGEPPPRHHVDGVSSRLTGSLCACPGDDETKGAQFVGLRVNTNQFGRTFQDRSYKFAIKPRPTAATAASNQADTPAVPVLNSNDLAINVNVRGKRGNIVQTYPAVSGLSSYDEWPKPPSLPPI
jgi:hypothetical protein